MHLRTVSAFVGLLFALSAFSSSAAWRRPRWVHHRPPLRHARLANFPKQIPVDPTRTFKELAIHSEFYMATDREKNFLKVKLSETNVRTVKTGEVLGPVPEGTLVIPAKAAQKAATKIRPNTRSKARALSHQRLHVVLSASPFQPARG